MNAVIRATPGPGPWHFLPEGALWHPDARIVVIADSHLGYERTRTRRGDSLPVYSHADVRARLQPILTATACEKIVVAGDVIDSRASLDRSANALLDFSGWLAALGVDPVFIRGNHDTHGLEHCPESVEIDGWTIRHGHDPAPLNHLPEQPEIVGHLHPALRWSGHSFRAFLSSSRRILLPAFTADAAGVDLADPVFFRDEDWGDHDCWVCRSHDVVPFGNLRSLRESLATLRDPAARATTRPRRSGRSLR